LNLSDFVPNVTVVTIDAGHCIQQEKPNETAEVILDWLQQTSAN
jgi:pimeloyl-ACP methyl ester carboxylesterase